MPATLTGQLWSIQSFHQHGRGWIDIAYHFVIDGTGQIWEGRPVTVIGAHVKDKNDGNVGISLMGDFHPPRNQHPTAAQFRSLVLLTRWLAATYNIPASRILGHRDQEATTCPGDILYARLDELRRDVAGPVPPISSNSHADEIESRIGALPLFSSSGQGADIDFDAAGAAAPVGKP